MDLLARPNLDHARHLHLKKLIVWCELESAKMEKSTSRLDQFQLISAEKGKDFAGFFRCPPWNVEDLDTGSVMLFVFCASF